MSAAHRLHADEIIWSVLVLVGIVTVMGLYQLDRIVAGPKSAGPNVV